MKIINRLYFKVVLIAIILIVVLVRLYYSDTYYQDESQYLKKMKQDTEKKIDNLEKKIINYKNEVKSLKANEQKAINIREKIIYADNITKMNKMHDKEIQKIKLNSTNKYKKMLMYNIHNQILQELDYAPYLPVTQLQKIIEKRFILDDISFKVYIDDNNNKRFDGVRLATNKTESIIRDSGLLEVRFDTK